MLTEDIKGYPNYKITDSGWVWSVKSKKYLAPRSDGLGYRMVTLCQNGKTKNYKIHRLVLEAFVGPCPEGMECRHLNGIGVDNRCSNLCWGTRKEQAEDRKAHGTLVRGVCVGSAKLTESQVRKIKILYATGRYYYAELGKLFSVSCISIGDIIRGVTWKHIN